MRLFSGYCSPKAKREPGNLLKACSKKRRPIPSASLCNPGAG